jgi:glycosyltransferase involved in cell wall biosynthesis
MIKPTISVVIPTCDRPEYLNDALTSVLNQTLLPQEILVIDNGFLPIDRNLLPRSELTNLIRALPHFGVSQARNLGSVLARFDMIAFLDDDDEWDKHYLESVSKTYCETSADIVLGRIRDRSSKKPLAGKQAIFNNEKDLIKKILLLNPGVVGSNTSVLRDKFIKGPGYDQLITTGQDKAMVLDLLLSGASIRRAENAWVDFRDDKNRPRQTELYKRSEGKLRFLKKYWKCMTWEQRFFNILAWSKINIQRLLKYFFK